MLRERPPPVGGDISGAPYRRPTARAFCGTIHARMRRRTADMARDAPYRCRQPMPFRDRCAFLLRTYAPSYSRTTMEYRSAFGSKSESTSRKPAARMRSRSCSNVKGRKATACPRGPAFRRRRTRRRGGRRDRDRTRRGFPTRTSRCNACRRGRSGGHARGPCAVRDAASPSCASRRRASRSAARHRQDLAARRSSRSRLARAPRSYRCTSQRRIVRSSWRAASPTPPGRRSRPSLPARSDPVPSRPLTNSHRRPRRDTHAVRVPRRRRPFRTRRRAPPTPTARSKEGAQWPGG